MTNATHRSETWNILVEMTPCSCQTGMARRKVLFNKRSTSKAEARRGSTTDKSLREKHNEGVMVVHHVGDVNA